MMTTDSHYNLVEQQWRWAESEAGHGDEFSAWSKFIAIVAALVTTEYAAKVSGAANLMLPSTLLIPALLLSMKNFDWPYGIFWLTYAFLLTTVAMLSTLMSAQSELRGLIFGLACFSPFMLLAFVPRPIERFMKLYCVVSAALMGGLVLFDSFVTGNIGPWTLPDMAGHNGAFLNMLWPLLLALSLKETGSRKVALQLMSVATLLAAFLLFSRAGLYLLVLSTCVLLSRKRTGIFFMVVSLIVCVCLLAPQWLVDWFWEFLAWYRIIDFEAESPRTLIWEIAEQAIRQHFLWGVGPGNAKFFLYGSKQYYEAHNVLIHVALEMGVLAASLMLLLEVYLISLIVRLLKTRGEGPFIAVALAAYVIQSMVEAYTNQPAQTVILTLTMVYGRWFLRQPREPDQVLLE